MILLTNKDFDTKAGQARIIKTIHQLDRQVHELNSLVHELIHEEQALEKDVQNDVCK